MHESRRSKKTKYLSDVYDTKRWRKVAGQPTDRLERIVFQICVDAFPWTSRKHAVNTINYVFLLIIYSIARKFEYICNAMPKFWINYKANRLKFECQPSKIWNVNRLKFEMSTV